MSTATTLDAVMAAAYADEELCLEDILGDKGALPTGSLAMDSILGCGGWPRGRTVELFGESMSGKSTAAIAAAVQAQARGERVVYLDFEQALDEPYMNALGLNTQDRDLFRPYPAASLEQGALLARKVVRSGEVGLVIFDSVAAMTPRKSVEEDSDSRTIAMERARLLGGLCAALNPLLARTGTTAIFVNHVQEVINTGPARPGMPKRYTSPGGSALKFYSSVRCQFKVIQTLKHKRQDLLTGTRIEEPHAALVEVVVKKNKLAPPFRSATLYLEFGKGFVDSYVAMTALVGNGIVRKVSSFYYFPEDLYHPQMKSGDKGVQMQGLQSVLDLAEMDPVWRQRLLERARRLLAGAQEAPVVVEAVPEVGDLVEAEEREPEFPEEGGPAPAPVRPATRMAPPVTLASGQTIQFVGREGTQ